MDQLLSDHSWLTALLQFESALASAQAELDLIPADAARAIREACQPDSFDPVAIGGAAANSGTPVLPLVEALRTMVGPKTAPFVHFGATSQDAIDTATMLLCREGLQVLTRDLLEIAATARSLSNLHRHDPMIARTLLQGALPITFGVKCASWLVGTVEAIVLLRERRQRLAVQLGGPVGTLEGYAGKGFELANAVAEGLGIAAPVVPWHAIRNRVGELGAALAVAAGAAAKISVDILLMAQAEVGEVQESAAGRSSSMAHKRNAIRSVEARAAFADLVGPATVLLTSMPGEHERAAGAWQSEWAAISDAFKFAAATINHTKAALIGLRVNTERMRSNLTRVGQNDPDLAAADAIIDRALKFYTEQVT